MAYYATYMPAENGELQRVVINAGVGFVLPFYGEVAPPGTLACDGSEVSREAYSELFAVLGTKAGAGDGSTTFNLPDLRGQFVRGTGGNAAALGVEQGDAIRELWGNLHNYVGLGTPDPEGVFNLYQQQTGGYMGTSGAENTLRYTITANFRASNTVPTAAENRPVNVALLWCIIYE